MEGLLAALQETDSSSGLSGTGLSSTGLAIMLKLDHGRGCLPEVKSRRGAATPLRGAFIKAISFRTEPNRGSTFLPSLIARLPGIQSFRPPLETVGTMAHFFAGIDKTCFWWI